MVQLSVESAKSNVPKHAEIVSRRLFSRHTAAPTSQTVQLWLILEDRSTARMRAGPNGFVRRREVVPQLTRTDDQSEHLVEVLILDLLRKRLTSSGAHDIQSAVPVLVWVDGHNSKAIEPMRPTAVLLVAVITA